MYVYRNLTPEQRAELVQERLARGYPSHSPPHPVRDRPFYMITATCYEHKCHMESEQRRQQVLEMLFEAFLANDQEICGWVVLPNHYHLLAHTTGFDVLGPMFRSIHGPTSRQWNLEDKTPGRKVWYRFTDRAIRSEGHYYAALNYIHYNPVKHGWTESVYDWPQSSVHWYLEHYQREWLRDLWTRYPIKDYGQGWDDF